MTLAIQILTTVALSLCILALVPIALGCWVAFFDR